MKPMLNLPRAATTALRLLRKAWWRVPAANPVGARHRCVMCGHRISRFLPYRDGSGALPAVLQAQDVIGSDVDNFQCPVCGCHDRERHLLQYLVASGMLAAMGGMRVLHFAPERHLGRRLASVGLSRYVLADLHPRSRGVRRLDLTAIDLPDAQFDLVIANHVLEHVADDQRALSEIHRVLRPGGSAILQTPYAARLGRTVEDPSIITDEARLQAYGQEDHCRLYGMDLVHRVVAAGFVSRVATHAELLPHIDAAMTGVNPREPFLRFGKPLQP
jgi:SAM-dependent methyltransferase